MGCRNDLAKVAETAGCEVILLSSFLLHPKSNPQHASKNKSAAIIAIAILAADFIKKIPSFLLLIYFWLPCPFFSFA